MKRNNLTGPELFHLLIKRTEITKILLSSIYSAFYLGLETEARATQGKIRQLHILKQTSPEQTTNKLKLILVYHHRGW